MERLWAGWRAAYLETAGDGGAASPFAEIAASERPDEETYVLWRGEHCFALLNLYPYTTGHLLVVPYEVCASPHEMAAEAWSSLWLAVRDAIAALHRAYEPEGVNVGINLGRAAGAGVPGHLHVHCVPRWVGDTNFTTSIANLRVLPESLSETWRKLRDAWPHG